MNDHVQKMNVCPLFAPLKNVYGNHTPHHKPILAPRRNTGTPVNSDGKTTFAGMYDKYINEIQNDRQWCEKTCVAYDSLVCRVLLPIFGDRAFEDFFDNDYLLLWDQIEAKVSSATKKRILATIIRAVVDKAFRDGYSITNLSNPYVETFFTTVPGPEVFNEKDEASRLAKRGTSVRCSLPLETQICYMRLLIANSDKIGECFAGLIMQDTGVRTSECAGFRFLDLIEVEPGYYGLQRTHLYMDDTDTYDTGGKTSNSYRELPVSPYLVDLIINRRKMLEGMYGMAQVDNMPICCHLSHHTRPCSVEQINDVVKSFYEKAGVQKAIFANAYQEIKSDPDLAEFRNCPTAYLARHQFATDSLIARLTSTRIEVSMGHAITDNSVERADFSIGSEFVKLSDALRRRPIVYALQNTAQELISYHGGRIDAVTNGNASIIAANDICNARLTLCTRQANEVPEVHCEGSAKITKVFEYQQPVEQYTNVSSINNELMAIALEKARLADIPRNERDLETPKPIFDDDKLLQKLAANDVYSPSTNDSVPTCAPVTHFESQPKVDTTLPDEIPVSTEKNFLSDPPAILNCFSNNNVYAITENNSVFRLSEDSIKKQNLNTRGQHIDRFPKTERLKTIVTLGNDVEYRLISRDGLLFDVPLNIDLSNCDTEGFWFKALLAGGVLLKKAEFETHDALVCATKDGKIGIVACKTIKRVPENGTRIFNVESSQSIVSACFVDAENDILIITEKGKGLRVTIRQNNIRVGKETSCIEGIKLSLGDSVVRCLEFPKDDLLFVKSSGKICRINADSIGSLLPHHRGSGGVAFVSVDNDDAVTTVCSASNFGIFVSNDCRALFASIGSVPSHNRGSGGVAGMALRAGKHLAGFVACTLDSDPLAST